MLFRFTAPRDRPRASAGPGELIELDAYRQQDDEPEPTPPGGCALARIPPELDEGELVAREDLAA